MQQSCIKVGVSWTEQELSLEGKVPHTIKTFRQKCSLR